MAAISIFRKLNAYINTPTSDKRHKYACKRVDNNLCNRNALVDNNDVTSHSDALMVCKVHVYQYQITRTCLARTESLQI